MKKLTALVLTFICVLALAGCNNKSVNNIIENKPNVVGIIKEAADRSILIENENGEYWVSLNAENKDSMTNFNIGDEVVVYYDGGIAESYPMQINNVSAIILKTPAGSNKWGITLEAEKVTSKGLILVCHQSGGENISDLMTGSYYSIQKLEGKEWIDVEYVPQEYDVAWTSEAWLVNKDSTTKWEINWEWLYGELPEGEYRIGKIISNFRNTGESEAETIYAEFVVK